MRRPVTAAQLSGQKLSSASGRYVTEDVTRAPSAPARAYHKSAESSRGEYATSHKDIVANNDTTSLWVHFLLCSFS